MPRELRVSKEWQKWALPILLLLLLARSKQCGILEGNLARGWKYEKKARKLSEINLYSHN